MNDPLRDWEQLGQHRPRVIQYRRDDGTYRGLAVSSEGLIAVTTTGEDARKRIYLLRQDSTLKTSFPMHDSNSGLYGVAFGRNNHFWVTDCRRNQVFPLAQSPRPQDGQVLQTIHGAEGHNFNHPCGVYVNRGLIYTCDSGNNRVTVHNENGVFQRSLRIHPNDVTRLFDPTDVTCDSHGCIYVADNPRRRVCVFYGNGNWKECFNVPYHECYLAATRDNRLVIVSNSPKALLVYTLNGDLVRDFGGEFHGEKFERPCGICVDNNGQVYVADENRVLVF